MFALNDKQKRLSEEEIPHARRREYEERKEADDTEHRSLRHGNQARHIHHTKSKEHYIYPSAARALTIAENLNRILAEEGFSLRFDRFNPGEFGVLSILDVTVAWLKEGKVLPTFGQRRTPGVLIKPTTEIDNRPVVLFSGFRTAIHPYPIARVHTKSGDNVHMTIANSERSDFDLIERIDALHTSDCYLGVFSSLLFPMVDFEETKNLDWLIGLETTGQPSFRIAKAAQQTKFKMNHTGARAKDAVTLTMRSTMALAGPPPLVIDEPFLLWIERPGLEKPIFYAYLDQTTWKDPGGLEM